MSIFSRPRIRLYSSPVLYRQVAGLGCVAVVQQDDSSLPVRRGLDQTPIRDYTRRIEGGEVPRQGAAEDVICAGFIRPLRTHVVQFIGLAPGRIVDGKDEPGGHCSETRLARPPSFPLPTVKNAHGILTGAGEDQVNRIP